MKLNKLIFAAATTFSIVGCSSGNKLPMPEGERTPLNQNGIPVELALAMARENQKMVLVNKPLISPAHSDSSNKNGSVHAGDNKVQQAQFSHAKNNKQIVNGPVVASKPLPGKSESLSPFKADRTSVKNAIVSEKVKAPIITTAPLSNGTTQTKAAASVIKPAQDSFVSPKLSMTPIRLNAVDAKSWVTVPGSTLRSTLIKWSSEDKCSSSDSWRVIWPVDIDYPMDSRLEFKGNFYEAITRLFDLYKKAQQPLYIDIYKSQCILSVSDAANSK